MVVAAAWHFYTILCLEDMYLSEIKNMLRCRIHNWLRGRAVW